MGVKLRCDECGKEGYVKEKWLEQFMVEDRVWGCFVCQECADKAPLDSYLWRGNPVILLPF
ncbi:MAG: hypothetical protein QXR93_06860 [Archaeoglobaceae archaeon]